MSIYKTSCPSCGQRDVRDPDGQGPIFDHNGPDGRECSVSDIDWNGAMALHPVAPVERRSYVSKERFEAAERECVQLRADNDLWREQGTAWVEQHLALARENDQLRAERDQALALLRAVLADCDADERSSVNLAVIRERITTHLDDEGQQR